MLDFLKSPSKLGFAGGRKNVTFPDAESDVASEAASQND
jgi:hypothetical protein